MANVRKKITKRLAARVAILLFDVVLVLVATICGYWMVSWSGKQSLAIPQLVLIWSCCNIALVLVAFYLFRVYSIIYSSSGLPDAIRITVAVGTVAVLNAMFVFFYGRARGIGYTHAFFYSLLLYCGCMASRFFIRFYFELKNHWANLSNKKTRVMIVGCNNDAFILIRDMSVTEQSRYKAVCILEDDSRYLGQRICDVRVVGTTKEAEEVAKKYKVEEIFVALPSANKKVQRETLKRLSECKLPMRLLPELSKMTHGEISVSKLRNVEIEDLLGREQVNTNIAEVIGYIEGKRVLVTGGGGSIGSELCRQIASHNPAQLIILDIYENNAYDIEQELKRHYPNLNLLTLIASVRDARKIHDVFEKHRPEIVFNAAAHKHVPLMETSPNEAVKNNVFGTLNVAKTADEYGVETFVQISTDKAVNPTNIMGATKRICEMIIQTLGKHSKNTKFVAVRFGNVLGSNGSVIPLFKRQIAEGGPVTITHKDIIRYFMTIPEAVSLVLQAGAYAQGGQIFVLDMGEPVRIYDLAYNLIKLSGLEPDVDIEIQFTGLRPGEKLYEERLMAEEGLQKTANGQISIAQPIPFDETIFWMLLDKLSVAAHQESEQMKEWVKELVPTYTIDERQSTPMQAVEAEVASTSAE